MLSSEDFKLVVQSAPLFSIDLIVLNQKKQILLGKRKNAPAKDYWFVPGGRVFKNESLSDAFTRISNSELGQPFNYRSATLLGLYDHFYNDSVFSENISTHYINASHLIRIYLDSLLSLPSDQHQDYRWADIDTLNQDDTVHSYSKVFLNRLSIA
ncbi:GDP-mannose mannosyl hydrolase [Marinomonas posidonica]|uniref:NUDIX hydrolase n=1 Tax=Marinomonas posidonica (strain CECT 7376 / NCIMB 14433 / IVIA-Po-181) TaxID=491952 RepID=F6CZ81_MARPP|nr:GDP-mannose mannosyl hydrolase [Marinomonas posidonica]AEF53537.1 NUDIX hydrolase [Marinomonas posidonica IVIA-Po-181]